MSRDTLTGSRIREKRIVLGLRQADMARQIGISASYLNLIEHNRRRIGGKLLVNIASVLGVEPSMLTEGAEAALIVTLREAAAGAQAKDVELDRADEFAGRFPGWSAVLAETHRRVAGLERQVEVLTDRLTHDPQLAASLHEVLSTAAAIRATASILAETEEIEPEWRDKFHRNINQDSQRLAESSKSLVTYLDDVTETTSTLGSAQEEAEAFFARRGYHFEQIETSPDLSKTRFTDIVADDTVIASPAGRTVAISALEQYAQDAQSLPLEPFQSAIGDLGPDPLALQSHFGGPLPAILRRLAAMPTGTPGAGMGLIVCDGAGSILFRKPVEGFVMPRYGAACPLWPVFKALSRPGIPILERVEQVSRNATQFDCYAVADPVGQAHYNRDPLFRATMLIAPTAPTDTSDTDISPIGAACRVCARNRCPGRREPSILREEF